MKTLSETLKEKAESTQTWQQQELRLAAELLKTCEGVSLLKPEYEAFRTKLRGLVAAGRTTLYEVVCNHCKTQMVNHEPGTSLCSNPPKRLISCPGCGWLGSTTL